MLFNVAFLFCLFVVTSVGATGSSSLAAAGNGKAPSTEIRRPEPGEIVEILSKHLKSYVSCRYFKITIPNSTGALQYKDVDQKSYDRDSYSLVVFVGRTRSKDKDGNVLVVIPSGASPKLFPLRLMKEVKEYFDNENPKITGAIMEF
jgi:hypothetical protein